jgi:hypothetical protein
MKIPLELFLDGIEEKKVYYFSSKKLNTSVPHYFVCVLKNNQEMLILVCCTSDKNDKQKRRIEILGLHKTLVWINPTPENGFSKDTFVNCNSIFEYTIEDFRILYEQNSLEFKGIISDSDYEQIINGLFESPTITEEIKSLIRK